MLQCAQQMIIRSQVPLNAEPPLGRLRGRFLTPIEDFYIRSHGNVPDMNGKPYRLTVGGEVDSELCLSMEEIKSRFAARRIVATLQCAGNRRSDMLAVKPVSGDPWSAGAIGTGEWTGVSLADVLEAAGIKRKSSLHIAFEGADEVDTKDGLTRFGASIPIEKALRGDVLLAHAMNSEPLRSELGAPLRVVVPGYAGVRSVKWLTDIRVQRHASANFHQQKDYKLFPAHMHEDTVDYREGMTIYEMPVNSAICEPLQWQTVCAGRTTLRGYAIAGERHISRVEVSINGGREWLRAGVSEQVDAPWAWTFWEAEVDLPPGSHELAVRAWDSAGQTQPALPDDVWNFKGYLCACWHRVSIKAE